VKRHKPHKSFVDFRSVFVYNKDVDKVMFFRKDVDFMSNILPVSDLKNYNEVLKNCQVGAPVFLTKNGRGRFVVMDIEDYERDRAEKKLLEKLQEAEQAVKDGNGWLSLDELKAMVGE
jgi:prevent-host-death family protein